MKWQKQEKMSIFISYQMIEFLALPCLNQNCFYRIMLTSVKSDLALYN